MCNEGRVVRQPRFHYVRRLMWAYQVWLSCSLSVSFVVRSRETRAVPRSSVLDEVFLLYFFPLRGQSSSDAVFQNDTAARDWQKAKVPGHLLRSLGTRGPFFSLVDSEGQFLRVQDTEPAVPVFTDLYEFMRWCALGLDPGASR